MKLELKFIRLFFILLPLLSIGCSQQEDDFVLGKNSKEDASNHSFLKTQSNTIKVATYNLHMFLEPVLFEDGMRQKAIVDFVRKDLRSNDVLFFSEVWSDYVKNEMAESLKDIYPYSIHSNAVNINQGDGLLILSKFPIMENHFSVFRKGKGFDWFTPKGFHKTRFSTPYGDFYSFFTHTQADEDKAGTRKMQFEQMKQSMQDLNGVPAMIVGDLNVIGDVSAEYKDIVKGFFSNFKDSYRETNPDTTKSPGFSYDNTINDLADYFFPVKKYGASRQRLDYFLVSDGLEPVSAAINNRCMYNSPSLHKEAPCSDHYALEATLLLKKKIQLDNKYTANNYEEAKRNIDGFLSSYGTGSTARIIVHNKTKEDLLFKNKTSWYNSTFYTSPTSIPAGKYGVVLATHNTGQATGVFNQLSYLIRGKNISFGTYVPWSWAYTNNILVEFGEITQQNLEHNSTRPEIKKTKDNIRLTGKTSKGDSPLIEFTVEEI
ncbi:endonuclease/exonuclease/phosphatase family protein [Porphyromonas pogonae]|uniref:endonuclease/exonuclease/phosphatase family protein n=1 Tax=Porphyromonas pogonae TaxID=867595 RepID=UPI002E78A5C8|nr:endonuclease/exonuclease/phosphatase family protein [Porphyromonas pogonae]